MYEAKKKQITTPILSLTLTIIILTLTTTIIIPPTQTNPNPEQTPIKDVIVGFTNTPNPQLLNKHNATILESYNIIPAIHAILPQDAIEQLNQNPNIAYITENTQTQPTGTINWAPQQINATTAWTQSTGTNIKIAILDTGINPIDDLKIHGGYNYIDNNTNTTDLYGHGTMIASIINTQHNSTTGLTGIAPDAQIYAIKVLNDQGIGKLNHAISGIQWAIENDIQIISISWCITDENNALKQALITAYSKGILIVAAAGNTGEVASGVGCPACYDTTIAVSAIKEDTRKLEQACTGPEIELTAPGEDIYAIGPDNQLHSGTGTSYATAYVTGTAALIWAKNPTLTNIQIRNILCQTATNLQPNDQSNRDIFFGYGLINATAALQATPNNTNPTHTPPPNLNPPKTSRPINPITISVTIIIIIITLLILTIITQPYRKTKTQNRNSQITPASQQTYGNNKPISNQLTKDKSQC
ncbi:S8 family peptidase [Candidatus Bathycorpusculum sp.]|uniref:S8 family peptidase n=1 Tax=Candidatus Bathycorpusculum sp. TaxID=2994959 RepID=UPI0028250DAF|nr:S8 family peptidase [Candidatus Termitimicrobium sp.]MCL2431711.1 S8 family peptidase [Candidatus Termitimicrobium sp.]MDR0470578.1 S8 family peptidase [Nitrososphaerota archaeon]